MAAAAGERVDIADDVAVAVPTGSACWVVRLLLLYPSDRFYGCIKLIVSLAFTFAFSYCISIKSNAYAIRLVKT